MTLKFGLIGQTWNAFLGTWSNFIFVRNLFFQFASISDFLKYKTNADYFSFLEKNLETPVINSEWDFNCASKNQKTMKCWTPDQTNDCTGCYLPKQMTSSHTYRVSHCKVGKVNWLWWGCRFDFLLVLEVLCIAEKPHFLPI